MTTSANRIPRWIMTVAMLAALMAVLAIYSGLQAIQLARVSAPFSFEIIDAPSEICLGGELHYTVTLDIQNAPLTIEVVRAWVQNGRTVAQVENKRPYAHPMTTTFPIVMQVPDTVQPGPVSLVVVGSAIYYEANGYDIHLIAKDCP